MIKGDLVVGIVSGGYIQEIENNYIFTNLFEFKYSITEEILKSNGMKKGTVHRIGKHGREPIMVKQNHRRKIPRIHVEEDARINY